MIKYNKIKQPLCTLRVSTAAVGVHHHGSIIHCNVTLLGRPVLRTTLEERNLESNLICLADIRPSIHPQKM